MVKTKTRSKNSSSDETRSAPSKPGSGLAALPVTEYVQQGVTGLGRDVVLTQDADGVNRRAHLIHMDDATGADPEVLLEAPALIGRERVLQVVGDELYELLAGHVASPGIAPVRA